MSIYNIHFCKKDEYPKLQKFINEHWHKGHVMGTSKELFGFQHDHVGVDYYDFAVAENTTTGEFDAIYGFIRNWKYDTSESIPNIGWGAIWKVREDVENPEIGSIAMKLMKYIIINGDIDILASLGISKFFKTIATSLHFNVGEMDQYYIANNCKTDFKIILNPEIKPLQNEVQYLVKELSSIQQLDIKDNTLNPNKNITYFINRYEKHPFFNYRYLGIYDNTEMKILLVFRRIEVEGSVLLRIVDAIGSKDINKSVFNGIQDLLKTENAEYIDCMNHGIASDFFNQLGFTMIDRSRTIIPEHLNPIEHKYIPLEYAYADDEPMVIFKGDGDQDRPNSLSELCPRN